MYKLCRDKYHFSEVTMLGFSEFLILITRTPNFENMCYPMRFLFSISVSMFFLLTGYGLKSFKQADCFLIELKHDALSVLLPVILVTFFIRSNLVFHIHNIYILWIIMGFYVIRTVYNTANFLLFRTPVKIKNRVIWTVMLLLGLTGTLLGFFIGIRTALHADVILAAFLPALTGLLLHRYFDTYIPYPPTKVIVLILSAGMFLSGMLTGQFIDPVNHRFPFIILGSIVSVGSAVFVILAAQYVLKLSVLRDICTTLGMHPVTTICIARLDTYVMRIWITRYSIVTILLRITADLAFILILSLAVNIVRPTRVTLTDQNLCQKYLKISDIYFYIAFTCLIIRSSLMQTMIPSSIPTSILNNWIYAPTTWMAYSMVLVFAIALSCVKKKAQFFLEVSIFVVTHIWYHERSVLYIYFLLILILSSTGKDFYKILKIYFFTVLSILIVAWWSSLHGYITNLIYYRDKVNRTDPRYALGANYVTDLASHWFYLIALICIAKPKRRNWRSFIAYPILLYIAYYIYHVTNARLNMIADLALIFITLLAHIKCCFRTGAFYKKAALVVGYILSFSYIFCTVLSFYLVANYNIKTTDMPFQSLLGKVMDLHQFKERLRISKTALSEFSINLFGNYGKYTEVGQGSTFMQTQTITFLDISYIKIPFMYGILIFVILLTVWTLLAFKNARQYRLFFVLILTIISLTGLVEHHLIEYYYNIFSLAVFTTFSNPPVSSNVRNNRLTEEQETLYDKNK